MSATPEHVVALVPDDEFGGNKRDLRGWETALLGVLCGSFTLFHLFVLNVYSLEPLLFRAIHVAWGGALGFILYAYSRRKAAPGVPWYDWMLVAVSIACGAYITVELDGLLFRAGAQWTTLDVVVGIVGTMLVLEFGRRTSGLAMVIIAGALLLYTFVGQWLPGVLQHRGYSFGQVFTYMYSEYGMFGVTTQVSSSYIILFVCFAAFLQVSKVGEYINDLSNALFGWARGGPAKACVASGAVAIWRSINILRALGWTILLALLVYAPLLAWRRKGDSRLARGLCVVVWIVIPMASYQSGADLWDNPRYRAMFAGPEIALAAWALVQNRQMTDPGLRRALVGIGLVMAWFVPWYLMRYVYLAWPVTDELKVLGLGIATATLYWIWDWVGAQKGPPS